MKFREIFLGENKKLLLGKDEKSNEELMKKFKGSLNVVLHTESPGSPFGVIDFSRPTKKERLLSGSAVARYSQDWRDNKEDVIVHVFKGKDVYKRKGMKVGTFGVRNFKKIIVKKKEIESFIGKEK
ncbi:MAG TPA: NFACT RNA binding domain-containing protein [Bacillota bacterium]|nr:NFACT RNA binding domain-containing protein [Bacillota bacterium]